jgi:hypothetical protein
MMVNVLSDWGRDDRAIVEKVLGQLVPPRQEPNAIQSIWRLVVNRQRSCANF